MPTVMEQVMFGHATEMGKAGTPGELWLGPGHLKREKVWEYQPKTQAFALALTGNGGLTHLNTIWKNAR